MVPERAHAWARFLVLPWAGNELREIIQDLRVCSLTRGPMFRLIRID